MQFRDLKRQYEILKAEIDEGIADVIASSQFISGKKVNALEEELAAATGRKHCVTCANGTDALEMVLRSWGIGEGDAVFVPSFTFMSTAEVVSLVGAQPVFVDINLTTFNMDPDSLEEKIKAVCAAGRHVPKAVIPVDLFGLPADYNRILPMAEKYGLKVLEDGAQGFGGSIRGKMACSFGEASTTSFFPAKPLGCYGDGGAIFTDDDANMQLLRSLCIHGKGREKYENIRIGRNSRLDTIQASILLPKLHAFFKHELDAVNHAAALYSELLAGSVITPVVPEGFRSSWAQYTILCTDRRQREHLQTELKANGIPSMIYYPCGLHRQQAFAYCVDLENNRLPATEKACDCVLSLPMHPYLADEEIQFVAETVKKNI